MLFKKQSESFLPVPGGGGWRPDLVRKLVEKGFALARGPFPVPLESHHLCATRHLPGPGQRLYHVTAQQALNALIFRRRKQRSEKLVTFPRTYSYLGQDLNSSLSKSKALC